MSHSMLNDRVQIIHPRGIPLPKQRNRKHKEVLQRNSITKLLNLGKLGVPEKRVFEKLMGARVQSSISVTRVQTRFPLEMPYVG